MEVQESSRCQSAPPETSGQRAQPWLLGLRDGLAANEKIADLTVDEIGVALEILFVDVEPRGRSEEALEPGYAHDMCRGHGALDRPLRNHDSWVRSTILPSTCPSARRS